MHTSPDHHSQTVNLTVLILVFTALFFADEVRGQTARASDNPVCEKLGWFPSEPNLKDHHIFWYAGYYYLVSNQLIHENRFAYARSQDFCHWEELAPILSQRTPGAWDELAIWAPFVFEENGVFHMFYTGVTKEYTQSILYATSTRPDEPDSWQTLGMIFQPDHADKVWEAGTWSDCRDPSVIKAGELYYLSYTGRDSTGSIIGLASASSPSGPWMDRGNIVPPVAQGVLESSSLIYFKNAYYLFYHHTGRGEFYRTGASLSGPWQAEFPIQPGWAHEVWQDITGKWHTSYLTNYTVTISPLTWDTLSEPAQPRIDAAIYHQILPIINRNANPLEN